MVTQSLLNEHTARRPFEPFWIRLKSGEVITVAERFRAVAMPDQFVVTCDGASLRRIPLRQIVAHGTKPTNGSHPTEASDV